MTGGSTDRDRSQAYTLEGVFAAIAILTALLFGLQVVDFGPWTGDTTEETSDLETRAEDMLDVAAETGALSEAVRCYPLGKQVFDGSDVNPNSSAEFEVMLNETFDEQDRQYNIYFTYMTADGERDRRAVSSNRSKSSSGVVAPTDSAAVATRTVTIFDDQYTRTTNRSGDEPVECGADGQRIENLDEGLLTYEDVAPNSDLYNVVEVRIVVW